MASVTSLSDENLILLHDLKTTCFLDGYSCHLSNDNFTVTEPEQLSYWLKEITYSELSPESATLFKSKVYHCDCCTTGTCSSSISYSCSACDEPYYSSNDYFTLYKDGSSLYSFVSYSDVKKEYEARGLNTSTEESDNSLTNIIQSKLDLSDITSALLYVCMILIAFLIADYLSDLVVRFFYSAHDETEYPDDYCSDEDWQEYLEEKAFRDNR